MTYRLEIAETARKDMRHLTDVTVSERIGPKLEELRSDPRPHGVKKLGDGLGWRIRIGDYRVIYEIDDKRRLISIVRVKPRQSAY